MGGLLAYTEMRKLSAQMKLKADRFRLVWLHRKGWAAVQVALRQAIENKQYSQDVANCADLFRLGKCFDLYRKAVQTAKTNRLANKLAHHNSQRAKAKRVLLCLNQNRLHNISCYKEALTLR